MSGNRISSKLDKRWIAVVFAFAACVAPFAPACGQEFPSRNMRLIVNVAPGGVTDALARLVGHGFNARWGKPAVVENLVGGNSSIAATAVARAKGRWTYAFCNCGRALHGDAVSRQEFEFQPFRLHAYRSDLPVRSGVRRQGVVGGQDIAGIHCSGEVATRNLELCISGRRHVRPSRHGGFQTAHRHRYGPRTVPRRRTGDRGLVRGDVDALITNYPNIAPFEQSGEVVLIAAAGDRRSDSRPDLPTAIEQGVSGFSVSTWFGIFGPAGMSPELTAKIRDGVEAVLESDKLAEYFKISSCERVKAHAAAIQ